MKQEHFPYFYYDSNWFKRKIVLTQIHFWYEEVNLSITFHSIPYSVLNLLKSEFILFSSKSEFEAVVISWLHNGDCFVIFLVQPIVVTLH